MSKLGGVIVGIIDRNGGIIRPEGLHHEEVISLFVHKSGNALLQPEMNFESVNQAIWDVPCDIFIPGAASKIVTSDQMIRLMTNGMEVISCGANVPFTDDKIFFGETARELDKKISLIPDFVANCGMARVFAYLMCPDVELTDKAIFDDTSNIIKEFLLNLYQSDKTVNLISSRALAYNLLELSKK